MQTGADFFDMEEPRAEWLRGLLARTVEWLAAPFDPAWWSDATDE